MRSFAEAIADGPLLLDGAMGSLLYERGVLHTRSYDELNLQQPELIATVHRDYVAAGAEIVETNTFGSNRIALARHGTTMADRPSNSATMGAKANTMIRSLSATCVSVKSGCPPVSRLQTKTIAVHGAAASRIRPAT